MKDQVEQIFEMLQSAATPKSRAWWTNYVKGGSPFIGTATPVIRKIVHQFIDMDDASASSLEEAVTLAIGLLQRPHSEEKIAGMLILKEYVIPTASDSPKLLPEPTLAMLFDEGYILDWNICDWFCIRVLGQLVKTVGNEFGDRLFRWQDAANLWRARASVVSFVPVISIAKYHSDILVAAQRLTRRDERFAKTGVGWILRELSVHDLTAVRNFIGDEMENMSLESLRNATKRFPSDEKTLLVHQFRSLSR